MDTRELAWVDTMPEAATFRIKGGSRVFTHEMGRHSPMLPSQETRRYAEYGKTKPHEIVGPPSVEQASVDYRYTEMAARCEQLYQEMVAAGVPREDARYVLPNGTTSDIACSANFREFRHIFSVCRNPRAHREVGQICMIMLKMILKQKAPLVFANYKVDEENMSATLIES